MRVDPLVLTVAPIEATWAFHGAALHARAVLFGEGRVGLDFDGWRINLHPAGREVEPKATRPTPASGDFCAVTDEPLGRMAGRLHALGIAVEQGPVPRTGAAGIVSVYRRDPDGRLVEIANRA